jgi:hypothetical protein
VADVEATIEGEDEWVTEIRDKARLVLTNSFQALSISRPRHKPLPILAIPKST